MTWVHWCLILLAVAWTCILLVLEDDTTPPGPVLVKVAWLAGLAAMVVAFIALWGWA